MGALDDARRRTGRFLRQHEALIEKAADRVKSATGAALQRGGVGASVERAGSPSTPARPSRPPSRPSAPSPTRSSPSGGPSLHRVREQAERLDSGVSRVGNETEVEQLLMQNTKADLMRRAHQLEIKGRSRMTKQQLAEEIGARG